MVVRVGSLKNVTAAMIFMVVLKSGTLSCFKPLPLHVLRVCFKLNVYTYTIYLNRIKFCLPLSFINKIVTNKVCTSVVF